MARVNVKFNKDRFSRRVIDTFEKVKKSNQYKSEVGKFVADRIRAEARRGKPFNKARKFPKLDQSTIKNRKRLAELNRTGQPFRPGFSNLTLTGQLLNALSFNIERFLVSIGIEDSKRKPYIVSKKGTRQKLKSGVNSTNLELEETLKEIGFEIFDPKVVASDPKIVKRIRAITIKFLRRAISAARLNG